MVKRRIISMPGYPGSMSVRISIGERGVRFPDDGNCKVNEDKKEKKNVQKQAKKMLRHNADSRSLSYPRHSPRDKKTNGKRC